MEPTVAVVIAAHNAERTLSKCIESLLDMDYPRDKLELVIVNDASSDETSLILSRYAERVTALEMDENRGPSVARNMGVAKTSAEYICFTDADCIVARDWVRELHREFRPGVGAVGGIQLSPEDETGFGRAVQGYLEVVGFVGGYTRRYSTVTEVDHNPSCNVMYSRGAFEEAGGFLAGLWPGEDVELAMRVRAAGYRILYTPRAQVYHYRPRTLRAFARMMRSYGQWSGGYLTRRHGFFRPLSYEPLGIVLLAAGALIMARVLGLAAVGAATLVGLTALFVVFWHATRGIREALLCLVLLVLTVVLWNAGFGMGLLSQRTGTTLEDR